MDSYKQVTHIEDVRRDFSEAELLEKGRSVAMLRQEVNRLEDEKKLASDSFKHQIESREADFEELCKQIRIGYELVPTPCDIVMNKPTPGMKSFVSQQTLQVIKTAPMTDAERQRSFFDPSGETYE